MFLTLHVVFKQVVSHAQDRQGPVAAGRWRREQDPKGLEWLSGIGPGADKNLCDWAGTSSYPWKERCELLGSPFPA